MKIRIKNPIWGIPITFLKSYCPTQFSIIDGCNRYLILDSFNINEKVKNERGHSCNINGKPKYFRVLIKKKDDLTPIPAQFEIIKFRKGDDDKDLSVNGKTPYFRILIKKLS